MRCELSNCGRNKYYDSNYYFFYCFFFLPCLSIHPYNENQIDALFILSLFLQSTSTCFGHICSPSSGRKLYILVYNNWCMLCFQLTLCWPAGQQRVNWKAQHVPICCACVCIYKHIHIYIYIYSIPPDDGLQIYSKHVEVDWRNKLRIDSASSCFSLHGSND